MALLEKYSKTSKTIEESRKDQTSILKHLDNIQTQLQEVKEERDLMTVSAPSFAEERLKLKYITFVSIASIFIDIDSKDRCREINKNNE